MKKQSFCPIFKGDDGIVLFSVYKQIPKVVLLKKKRKKENRKEGKLHFLFTFLLFLIVKIPAL